MYERFIQPSIGKIEGKPKVKSGDLTKSVAKANEKPTTPPPSLNKGDDDIDDPLEVAKFEKDATAYMNKKHPLP